MKNFEDYEEDIYKCSRCGLCQSVCPVYKASLNECAVSRGKFNILNGIIKGDLHFSDNVKKYLDLCTGCNACKDFCPSGIDAREIFVAAKREYYKDKKLTPAQKFLNSYFLFKTLLCCTGAAAFLMRISGLTYVVKFFENIILKTGYLGKRLVLLNSLIFPVFNKKLSAKKCTKKQTAVYFEGCFNKYINDDTEKAVKFLLEQNGIGFIKKDFECCGISYLQDGNTMQFEKLMNTNINKQDCDCDYLITDCASCNFVLKEYQNYANTRAAADFSSKVTGAVELIKDINFEAIKPLKVAVHKPCHDSYDFIEVVKNIRGIDFVEVEDYDKCCGFSGKFAIQNQKISREISRQKMQHYTGKDIDFVITTCPACLLGLNQGLAEIDASKKPFAINLFVFLAKYCHRLSDAF